MKTKITTLIAFCLIYALALSSCGLPQSGVSDDSGFAESIIAEASENAGNSADTGESQTEAASSDQSGAEVVGVEYKNKDTNSNYDEDICTVIELADNASTVTGTGAEVNGNVVTINESGYYILRGSLTDGQIIVNCESGTVRLVLDGVSVACSNSAPLYGINGDIVLILAENSENSFADGTSYVFAEGTDEPSACVFTSDDLSINGVGTLTVTGNYNNGIQSKDTLKITGGSVNVSAVNNGIKGKDYVAISGGIVNISSTGDGIKSDNETEAGYGFIQIDGGTITVTSGDDGVQAYGCINLNGGTLSVTAAGDGLASDGDINAAGTDVTVKSSGTASKNSTVSQKGMKAADVLYIAGGVYNFTTNDDAVHSDNEIQIDNGEFTISSGDDGIHADTKLTINGGTINITNSYEGLESMTIYINGGDIDIASSDDGINAAGGSTRNTSSYFVKITGGDIYINASGDGFDSNGNMAMTGGTLVVDGPTNSGNGAVDYEGTFVMTGGTLIAGGSTGMAMTPSSSSTQYSVNIYTTVNAGSTFTINDSDGNEIVSYVPVKSCASVVVCCPALKAGTYTYTVNGTATSFTISSNITTVGTGGGMNPGGQGGFGGGGRR